LPDTIRPARRLAALRFALATALAATLALWTTGPRAGDDPAPPGFQLLMIEAPHCVYCRVFNRDVAPIYAIAPEGRAAPLVHVQLRGPLPDGVTLASRPAATPTFILIGPDGVERDRLVGYPGDDFFWAYLDRMFDRAGVERPAEGGADAP